MKISLLTFLALPLGLIVPSLAHIIQVAPQPDIPGYTGLGVGGVLAAWMFYSHKKYAEGSEAKHVKTEERVTACLDKNADAMVKNAEAMTRLTEVIEGDTLRGIRKILEDRESRK